MVRSIEPMTLGNMRANGVRALAIRCGALWCNHETILDVDAFADGVVVPSCQADSGTNPSNAS